MQKDFRHTSGALEDEYFYGRHNEIALLHHNIDIRQHTALLAQRQFGKTSLVFKAVERHPDKPFLAHIDLTRKASLAEAAKSLVDGFMYENFGIRRFLIMAVTNPATLLTQILRPALLVKKIKLKEFELEIREIGTLASMEDASRGVELFVRAVEFIDAIATKLDRKSVIFIDEFQRLIGFPEQKQRDIMWPLRSAIQNSKSSTLIVAGSQPSVINKIINDKDGAFLHSFIVEEIHGVLRADFAEHFEEVCAAYKVDNLPIETDFVYNICGGIPSYLSLFGRKLFDDVRLKRKLTNDMYFKAIGEMYHAISGTLRLREERLNEINMGIVVYKSVFAGDNPKKEAVRLSGTSDSNIQNSTIKRMEDEGYILKVERGVYRVVDPVFGYYLAEITSGDQFAALFEEKALRSFLSA